LVPQCHHAPPKICAKEKETHTKSSEEHPVPEMYHYKVAYELWPFASK